MGNYYKFCCDLHTKCRPTLLDAVVYGCIEAIIDTNTPLVGVLSAYKNLNQFCQVSVFSQRKGLQFITSPSSATLVSSSH